jgi:uncharacterized coiled-coil protein SlyX
MYDGCMSEAKSLQRKSLEKRLLKAEARVSELEVAYNEASDALNEAAWNLQNIKTELKELKPKAIKVTDHAVLRYLEREAGVDTQAIKAKILEDPELNRFVETLGGSGKFPVGGFRVVMKDYSVVTIT